jgi:uncharacterized membrane protein
MGVDGDLYNVVLVLHILAAIIGFGGMFIAGFYGNEAGTMPGREGLAVAQTTLKVTGQIPTVAVCAVPILGILLILMSEDAIKFSAMWVSLSFLLYIVLMGLATGIQVPTIRKMVAMRAGAEGATSIQMQAMGKKVATISAVVNVLWVVILILMVFKPGQ